MPSNISSAYTQYKILYTTETCGILLSLLYGRQCVNSTARILVSTIIISDRGTRFKSILSIAMVEARLYLRSCAFLWGEPSLALLYSCFSYDGFVSHFPVFPVRSFRASLLTRRSGRVEVEDRCQSYGLRYTILLLMLIAASAYAPAPSSLPRTYYSLSL